MSCGCASLLGALVTLLLVRKNTARTAVNAAVRTASVWPTEDGRGSWVPALLCDAGVRSVPVCHRLAPDVPRP
ncbi:hypothetical protein BEK98_26440 [Streptomyces diastatochromogenes]|uniref:Uncharacterized protein n=1 Tax=Streptomyces diastatochromogenes TaxID=42236 RepID=A0A233S9N2_STRDA|nr:hypothetical protein BEK98_26440 [Streptomyces diastatochromogenes]